MDSQFVGGVRSDEGKVDECSTEHFPLRWCKVVELGAERDVSAQALTSLR